MNKKTIKIWSLAITAIIGVVYTVITILSTNWKTPTFWVALSFTWISLIVHAVIDQIICKKGNERRELFLGFGAIQLGVTYVFIQLIIGTIIMLLPIFTVTVAFCIQLLLLAIYTILISSTLVTKGVISNTDVKTAEKVFYIKSLGVDVEGMISSATDNSVTKALSELKDTIRYSDPMSHASLGALENKIEIKMAQLADGMQSNSPKENMALINEIQSLIADRNRKCKILK
ncbi:hypothetical protein [Candidatus Clostridium stratigraminis]|uniref:Uncharacterized protein n=1 Tax=Candidatus Clostridium stratigraminis TaxID=3381661 RepID=A0ABW8TCJ8_9CLOT